MITYTRILQDLIDIDRQSLAYQLNFYKLILGSVPKIFAPFSVVLAVKSPFKAIILSYTIRHFLQVKGDKAFGQAILYSFRSLNVNINASTPNTREHNVSELESLSPIFTCSPLTDTKTSIGDTVLNLIQAFTV